MSKNKLFDLVDDIINKKFNDKSVEETMEMILLRSGGVPQPAVNPELLHNQPKIITRALKQLWEYKYFMSVSSFREAFIQQPELKEEFSEYFVNAYINYLATLITAMPSMDNSSDNPSDK